MATITIDKKEYSLDALSEEAKSHVAHLQYCDRQLAELELSIATLKTARLAYARALSELLPTS